MFSGTQWICSSVYAGLLLFLLHTGVCGVHGDFCCTESVTKTGSYVKTGDKISSWSVLFNMYVSKKHILEHLCIYTILSEIGQAKIWFCEAVSADKYGACTPSNMQISSHPYLHLLLNKIKCLACPDILKSRCLLGICSVFPLQPVQDGCRALEEALSLVLQLCASDLLYEGSIYSLRYADII